MKEGELGEEDNSKAGSTNIHQQRVRISTEVRVAIRSRDIEQHEPQSGDNPAVLPMKQV